MIFKRVENTDQGYGQYRLNYIRTLDKKEIDFVVCRDGQPLMAVEVKQSETSLSKPLLNRHHWLPDFPTIGIQVVDKRNVLQKHGNDTWVMSIERLLSMMD